MVVKRLDPKARLAMIRKAAVIVAKRDGVMHLDHANVAAACDVETSESTVRRYCHTLDDLRELAREGSSTVSDEMKRLGLY